MSVTTMFLGNKFGFHLYTMSMIPILFTTEYLAYKVRYRKIETTFYAILVVAMYMISTIHAAYIGPVYDIDPVYAGFFWFSNSLIVIGLLTYYARLLIRQIIESDKKQTERANTDFLTHLYNRHYMMKRLNEAYDDDKDHYIAMIDVDDFKKINDVYGHIAGDEVLKKIAEAMNDVCRDCKVSRWGGEEFLILTDDGTETIEKLRKTVEDIRLEYEGREIKVTITAGVEEKDKSVALNKWIVAADEKLYIGKQNGKNTVVA
ncbi:MAG: GGDEF domain-containing protein [Lachnospiraceae bacterium]|nr:GGDEF domain-containing protein [Lachnospiraceae bacterium]